MFMYTRPRRLLPRPLVSFCAARATLCEIQLHVTGRRGRAPRIKNPSIVPEDHKYAICPGHRLHRGVNIVLYAALSFPPRRHCALRSLDARGIP